MNIIELTSANFDEAIAGDTPILVDFWATWCGPCRLVAPILEEIAQDYQGKLIIGRVDVDAQSELAVRFSVMSIPTLMLFKSGEALETTIGAQPKARLAQMIDKYV